MIQKNFLAKKGGFQIKFPNNLILSTQFTEFNYCENYGKISEFEHQEYINSNTCEIAILNENMEFVTQEVLNYDDDVMARVDMPKWLEIFEKVKNYKNGK